MIGIPSRPAAVLFDRDGTLVADVAYNGDPDKVTPMPTAPEAVRLLRAAGIATGVISNQSGVARGLLSAEQVDAVNQKVDALLGPFDVIVYCPHGPDDGCGCRKPRAGLVHRAAAVLGLRADQCAVVGDIGSDVDAATAAGARGVLVPTAATRAAEIAAAPEVVSSLLGAAQLLLAAERAG
jgi:D-glycero-D-manno-heptose 1,7-bisphosphate phosphatase